MSYSNLGKKLLSKFKPASCFIGFDGFTDNIISVVDKVLSQNNISFIKTMKDFGGKIADSSHKSCNFQLVTTKTKLGGNAPIFTNALLEGGHSIVFAGAIGKPHKVEPLFSPMAKRCKKVYSMAESGKTDALEFHDGKIILGKHESLKEVNYQTLLKLIDEKSLIKLLDKTDLLATVNWTMISGTTEIWKKLLTRIAPKFSKSKQTRYLFVDLADPRKRTDKDILEAMHVLARLNKYYHVILGLNISEAEIISRLFKIKFTKEIKKTAYQLFKKLKISRLIIHHATFALVQDEEVCIHLKSFPIRKLKIKTGAGDNFNAGYCNALLYGLSKEETLMTALATAGFYVEQGHSPTMRELSEWLN
jgi:sugar/nucleoside kinase (ribokinase family)